MLFLICLMHELVIKPWVGFPRLLYFRRVINFLDKVFKTLIIDLHISSLPEAAEFFRGYFNVYERKISNESENYGFIRFPGD